MMNGNRISVETEAQFFGEDPSKTVLKEIVSQPTTVDDFHHAVGRRLILFKRFNGDRP